MKKLVSMIMVILSLVTAASFSVSADTSVAPALVKENGIWYYYVDGAKSDATTLVKYKGKWFYVENGVWKRSAHQLVEYCGKTFYVKYGKWQKGVTTLFKQNGKWHYIKNGKWEVKYERDLVEYKGKHFLVYNGFWQKSTSVLRINGTLYYIRSGIWWTGFDGLVYDCGKLYYIKDGLHCEKTFIGDYKGYKWYIVDGNARFVSGKFEVDGKLYTVRQGKVIG